MLEDKKSSNAEKDTISSANSALLIVLNIRAGFQTVIEILAIDNCLILNTVLLAIGSFKNCLCKVVEGNLRSSFDRKLIIMKLCTDMEEIQGFLNL